MGTASPDLEKQGFFAVVFVNREYSVQQETAPRNYNSNSSVSCSTAVVSFTTALGL